MTAFKQTDENGTVKQYIRVLVQDGVDYSTLTELKFKTSKELNDIIIKSGFNPDTLPEDFFKIPGNTVWVDPYDEERKGHHFFEIRNGNGESIAVLQFQKGHYGKGVSNGISHYTVSAIMQGRCQCFIDNGWDDDGNKGMLKSFKDARRFDEIRSLDRASRQVRGSDNK